MNLVAGNAIFELLSFPVGFVAFQATGDIAMLGMTEGAVDIGMSAWI